jgi:diacylglycerol kinase family enzyme
VAPSIAARERRAPERAAAAQPLPPGAAKKRMLIIVNPYATTVSDRLKNLVVYALQARYEVEAVDTEAVEHAMKIGRDARSGDYDIVVAFGGDGTLNEVANGLAGTDVPVSVLPGGSTNVVCRTLGIPNDVVDATEHLIGIADDFRPRKIDLGVVNGRHFVFGCGVGLDASVVQRVDAHPRLKTRARQWYYTSAALSSFYRDYLGKAARFELQANGRKLEGVTAIAQNSDPFTYFGEIPVRICEDVGLDDGALSVAVLRRAAQRDVPSIIARALSPRLRASGHRHIEELAGVHEAHVRPLSRDEAGNLRRLPVQVDGDYIGEHAELHWSVEPGALTIIA